MARPRPRSTSNVSITNTRSRPPTTSPQLKRTYVMASDSIYQNNITVIRRRDPSVLSILDSFSHVCLYHFNGADWEKRGFEGTMFLVEHQDLPRYGIFILNRMGTGDYGRRVYPEDDMQESGQYLMYRYYPDYTKKRTEMNLPYPLPPEYRISFDKEFEHDASRIMMSQPPNPAREKKGNSITLGFWTYPTNTRESLATVMTRLHKYVKADERYPDEFRYGPGRPPPPPDPRARSGSQSSSLSGPQAGASTSTQPIDSDPQRVVSVPPPNSAGSEVDKLFAKLQPPDDAPQPSVSAQGWLAALNGQPNGSTPSPALEQATPTRGLSLLNSIFASVQPSASSYPLSMASMPSDQFAPYQPPTRYLPPHPEEIQIVSPKPTSSALPQILNQDVISTLLGLSPDVSSRASSVAPSNASSHHSGSRSYDGEYEHSDAPPDSEYSANSHVDPAILETGTSSSRAPSDVFPSLGQATSLQYPDGFNDESKKVQGDATPRMPARKIGPGSPPLLDRTLSQQYLAIINGSIVESSPAPAPQLASSSSSNSITTVKGLIALGTPPESSSQGQGQDQTQAKLRTLVPFEADSELWPYPRAPVDERSPDIGESDVVELDFSDTRALSDPIAFSNCLKEKQQHQNQQQQQPLPLPQQQKPKVNGKKKSRRERAIEREREREAIENGWDDPTQGQARKVDMVTTPGAPTAIASPPSPPALPPPPSQVQIQAPVSAAPPMVNGKTKPSVNGTGTGKGGVDPEELHPLILAAVASHSKAPVRDVSRKQFMQEVLGLIYSDNAFVDRLWSEYTGQSL